MTKLKEEQGYDKIYRALRIDSDAHVGILYAFSNIPGKEDLNGNSMMYSLMFYVLQE